MMVDTMDDTALRIVLGVKELEAINSLRNELGILRNEIELWKGGKELPEVGKYYFADEKILENHGWSFDEGVALRYEGVEENNVTRSDGTTRKYLDHIFTAPFTYDTEDHRTGWIKIGFETHDLHQTSEVVWDEIDMSILYLDHNNQQAEW